MRDDTLIIEVFIASIAVFVDNFNTALILSSVNVHIKELGFLNNEHKVI